MNKLYVKMVAYDPAENKVTVYRAVDIYDPNYDKVSDEIFFKVYGLANRTTDIILGKTISGDFYQLSPTPYGTYIREDATSVSRFLDKSKILVAIANYQKEKNIPFDR